MVSERDRLLREVEALRSQNGKLADCLREKDSAMGVLFERLDKAGVDYSDLIP